MLVFFGNHPHGDRLGGGKVSNQKTNVQGHSLCQALSKALYTQNPDTCLSCTSTSMLLLAESETCIFKTYFKVLCLISFLFHSSLTSLKFFFWKCQLSENKAKRWCFKGRTAQQYILIMLNISGTHSHVRNSTCSDHSKTKSWHEVKTKVVGHKSSALRYINTLHCRHVPSFVLDHSWFPSEVPYRWVQKE